MRWLDSFDIERFQKIVFQTDDFIVDDKIIQENNKYDMKPEFDFGLFDIDELMKMNDDFDWDKDIDLGE